MRCAVVVLLGAAGCRSDRSSARAGGRSPHDAAADSSRAEVDTLPQADSSRAASATADSAGERGTAAAAVAVIRDYYAAIDAHDYRRAYAAWEQRGAASGQSFDAFRRGFDSTASVTAMLGAPSRIEGAAGSRYVTVPVRITARTVGGDVQHFQGTYTLRRAVVTGATPEQRTWHIYSAKVAASGGGSHGGEPLRGRERIEHESTSESRP